MAQTYLTEALSGDYGYRSEDRLSQIFSACFNNSPAFQKAVEKFRGSADLRGCKSVTQLRPEGVDDSRLDIVISDDDKARVVIESKIDSILTAAQPRKYNRIQAIGACKLRYCLVKHYQRPWANLPDWAIKYWGDLYRALDELKTKDFIIENFIAILKEYGMENPSVIKRENLQAVAKAMSAIRFKKEPSLTYTSPIFETLAVFRLFLEDLFRMAATDPVIRNRAGKNFWPRMRIAHWWEEKKKGATYSLWLGSEVDLPKGDFRLGGFGAALLFYGEKNPKQFSLVAYVTEGADRTWKGKMLEVNDKDIHCAKFKSDAIKFWSSRLR